MFLAMRLIFLSMMLLLLGGCEREPAVISPPKGTAAVIEPFLKDLRAGNKAAAARHVSPAAVDELEVQFAADHKLLAAAPPLTPRYTTDNISPSFGEGQEVTLVYAAKQGEKWTSATVRVYRYRDEAYQVEYWRITDKPPVRALSSGATSEKNMQRQNNARIIALGLGALAIFGLVLLVWLLRRKPHLVAAENAPETRQPARTIRD